MSRPLRFLALGASALSLAALGSACGTEKIELSKSNPLYQGAVLFNQRCSGCHSLSYAAAHGSAANVRTSQYNNGPNFNIRCERPMTRVLYAIANGGFSGQIMPQNIVVGQQAIEVAKFVATYAGRQAPKVPGSPVCSREPVGTVPAVVANAAASIASTPGSNAPIP
jgi:mono/diheme cytochrome c family protein